MGNFFRARIPDFSYYFSLWVQAKVRGRQFKESLFPEPSCTSPLQHGISWSLEDSLILGDNEAYISSAEASRLPTYERMQQVKEALDKESRIRQSGNKELMFTSVPLGPFTLSVTIRISPLQLRSTRISSI